jgi:hypothetical protein
MVESDQDDLVGDGDGSDDLTAFGSSLETPFSKSLGDVDIASTVSGLHQLINWEEILMIIQPTHHNCRPFI